MASVALPPAAAAVAPQQEGPPDLAWEGVSSPALVAVSSLALAGVARQKPAAAAERKPQALLADRSAWLAPLVQRVHPESAAPRGRLPWGELQGLAVAEAAVTRVRVVVAPQGLVQAAVIWAAQLALPVEWVVRPAEARDRVEAAARTKSSTGPRVRPAPT